VALAGTLYWSPTLALGVILLAGSAGWILGAITMPAARPGLPGAAVDRQ
jgi:hypothetical protein